MMKKTLISLALCYCMAMAAAAQNYDEGVVYESENGQRIRITEDKNFSSGFSISIGGYEVAFTGSETFDELPPAEKRRMRYRKRYRGHLSYIDFGFNGFTSPNYSAYAPSDHGFLDLRNGKSIYFGFNILKTSTALDRRGNFGFTTGLSLVWRNYSFDHRITIDKQAGKVVPVDIVTNNFKKSKLTTFSLNVPILFEANFSRHFFLSAGGYAGLAVGSHTKYKAPKTKSRSGNSIEMFEYGITARAGFRHMYVFGNYGFNPVFKSGTAPKTNTYTVGFSFPF